MKKIYAIVMAVLSCGCATSSKDIASTQVSPEQYASFDCEQVAGEASRLQERMGQLGARLDKAAENDKAITAAGFLVWPAFFFLGGTKQQETEYARLKGEHDALQQTAVVKKCALPRLPQPQEKTATEKS